MSEIFFNFGDLVRIDGYWPRVFKVDGYRREQYHYPNEQWNDVVFEVVDAHTGEFLEADVDDLTLVETADKADEWLAANPLQYETQAPIQPDWMTTMFGGEIPMSKPKEPRKPTARELSAQLAKEQKELRKKRGEHIDDLLDLRNWASEMLEKTNDETYGDRVLAIDAELKQLTESE